MGDDVFKVRISFLIKKKKDLPSFVSISSAVPQEKFEMQKKC
jgi:hypothetical protein